MGLLTGTVGPASAGLPKRGAGTTATVGGATFEVGAVGDPLMAMVGALDGAAKSAGDSEARVVSGDKDASGASAAAGMDSMPGLAVLDVGAGAAAESSCSGAGAGLNITTASCAVGAAAGAAVRRSTATGD